MKISRQPSPLQIMIDDKTGNAVLGNGGARWLTSVAVEEQWAFQIVNVCLCLQT